MKSTDNVGITFASHVLTRGVSNGVVNVTFGAKEFNPDEKNQTVDTETVVIVSRLRMDVPCAMALRDAITELLLKIEATPATVAVHEGEADVEANNGAAKH